MFFRTAHGETARPGPSSNSQARTRSRGLVEKGPMKDKIGRLIAGFAGGFVAAWMSVAIGAGQVPQPPIHELTPGYVQNLYRYQHRLKARSTGPAEQPLVGHEKAIAKATAQ